jgi:AraC-like DNA-binding protein
MTYREFGPKRELHPYIACTWERRVPAVEAPTARVLPDGCVDLVWRGGELLVAGPDSESWLSGLCPEETVVGLRLRPGIAGSVLGLPASELRNQRPPVDRVWGALCSELNERVGDAEEPWRKRELLEGAIAKRLTAGERPDPLVLAATRRLGFPGSRIGFLSDALGLSERQLLRRFNDAVGYGPKTLDRVLRFQRFRSRAQSVVRGDDDLARVAADLGYSDQAHLSRDCMRLSGLTPTQLAESRTRTASLPVAATGAGPT